jgi:CTP:phosphocholine cytidylyltransferase-like protein
MSMFNNVMTCMLIIHDGLQSCTQMTLDIRMLKNIFLLHDTKSKQMTLTISMLNKVDNQQM